MTATTSSLVVCALLASATVRADAVAFIYHRFGEDQYPTTNVTLAQFDAHLDHLAKHGYEVWPLERIVAALQDGTPLPPHVVAITMDDGFESIYTGAYPRLKARGWPFTVFVNTDALDRKLSGYLSWDQVKEMAQHGARFGNHTATHDRLWQRHPGETDAQWTQRVRTDVGRAQTRLQAELGQDTNESPRLFAYPYGEYDAALARLVAQMRYVAFGQQSGAIARLDGDPALPRYPMADRYAALDEFAQKAATRALPVERGTPIDPRVGADNPPTLHLRLPDASWRDRIACYYNSERLAVAWQADGRGLTTRAARRLEPGHNRYNCTGRDAQGAWYWFSQVWVVE